MQRIVLFAITALWTACAQTGPHQSSKTSGLYLLETNGTSTLAAGDNDDWSGFYCSVYGVCSLYGDAGGSTLTGIDQAYYGDREYSIWIYNRGTVPFTLAHDRTSSSQNRLHLRGGVDVSLAPGYAINLWAMVDTTTDPFTPMGWYQLGWNEVDSATPSTPTRSLGTAFRPNVSRITSAHYSVKIDATITVSGGQAGRVELLSDTANPPTTIRASVPCGSTGTVVVGVSMVTTCGDELSYTVPAGHYVLLRSVNVTSTPTYTIVNQVEETL